MKWSRLLALVLALGGALLLVSSAFAHARIASCAPALNASVAQAPKEVRCTLTENADVSKSALMVFDANNAQVDNKDLKADQGGKVLFITLDTAKMKNGVYTVKWTTVSADDGEKAEGQWQFGVGVPVVLPQTGADNSADVTLPLSLALGGLLLCGVARRLRRAA